MKIGVHGEFGAKPPKIEKKIFFDQRPPPAMVPQSWRPHPRPPNFKRPKLKN